MRTTKRTLSGTSIPRKSGARYLGIVAVVALAFSLIVPPFVGPSSLMMSVQPLFSQLQQAGGSPQYLGLVAAVSILGVISIVLGSLLSLVSFGFRYGVGRARAGMLACVIGLLLITATLFDYTGDFMSKILTVVRVGVWPSLEFYGTGYFISWLAVIIGLIAAGRAGKRPSRQATVLVQPTEVVENLIPIGYAGLDNLLYGGVSPGTSIVLTAPPCDEKDMIIKRFMKTNLTSGRGCIYISSSIDRVQDLLSTHAKALQVILCHPQADTVAAEYPEVVKLHTVDNLTEINLRLNTALAKSSPHEFQVLCLEILDDVLLSHHAATRRWLMDILGRSKSSRVTCLATLNPAMHPATESQMALETFDGHIDMYEAELHVHPKLIRVKKMGGRKFLENDLLVQRDSI